jgi:hypothetical protein
VASEDTVIAVPDRVTLNIDGRDTFTVYGNGVFVNFFKGEIS